MQCNPQNTESARRYVSNITYIWHRLTYLAAVRYIVPELHSQFQGLYLSRDFLWTKYWHTLDTWLWKLCGALNKNVSDTDLTFRLLRLIHPLLHLFIQSFIHSFWHSLIRSLFRHLLVQLTATWLVNSSLSNIILYTICYVLYWIQAKVIFRIYFGQHLVY